MGALIILLAAILGLPSCATEDSTNCHWDAAVQGNGAGASFLDIDGTIILKGN